MVASEARYMICRTQRILGIHAEEFTQNLHGAGWSPILKVAHIKSGPLNGEGAYNAFSKARVERSKSR